MEAASVYFHLGRIAEGVEELKAGPMVDPVNPGLLTGLTLYSIQYGDEAEAREWVGRARDDRKVARDQLRSLEDQFRNRFGHNPY